MRDRWSDAEAARVVERYGPGWSEPLALRVYTSRLLGGEPDLVLHGGGNTSLKAPARDLFGFERPALYVKASGRDLAAAGPEDHTAADRRLLDGLAHGSGGTEPLDDAVFRRALRAALFDPDAPTPSIEAPVHAVVPGRYVDHTHADAVLALGNRPDGEAVVRGALGEGVLVLPYVTPGQKLARAVAAAVDGLEDEARRAGAMVWLQHGIVTWGETAEASYRRMIELVSRAEEHLRQARRRGGAVAVGEWPPEPDSQVRREPLGERGLREEGAAGRGAVAASSSDPLSVEGAGGGGAEPAVPASRNAVVAREDTGGGSRAPAGGGVAEGEETETRGLREGLDEAAGRWARVALVLRGLLAVPSGDADRPWRRMVLQRDSSPSTLALLARPDLAALAAGGPLTADHLIRTKAEPLLLADLPWDDDEALRSRLADAVREYESGYSSYVERHRQRLSALVELFPPGPRVVLVPTCGVIAAGADAREARVALDVAVHTLRVKAAVADAGGTFEGLPEAHLFDMEYRPMQLDKLARAAQTASLDLPQGTVALVTGAAGAIGAGVCRRLLAAGAHLAATDLAGPALDSLAAELAAEFPGRVLAVPLDVTDADGAGGVAAGLARVAAAWGGVDLVVVNAGAAHVARLETMELADFERLERINVHGTLLVVREAARHFRRQATGGDVVVVSTKNVFAPGAGFGAYSATKAASHQLARIASQELAELDVRVNMVAPDAVFGAGDRRSGLWQEVGPDRMKARGLSEEGLEDYYRQRNLLKARVTADHVGRAVLWFAGRHTPTTGATLPVDGGLPDATPR
jgi:rhamnose utilization protein RhaD (predicted bifunctional aldolase and dehydrogenase)/NAD(P)-dependent dehydrogenase (short-subunit alcohol dehydrogenase family)